MSMTVLRYPVLFVVGPTASGKTKMSLLLANFFNGEIISADSMQVYKGMDIGTDKVSPQLRKKIPHYLVDIIDPSEEYSAYQFSQDAIACIDEIHKRNRLPIVVGGSGLYIKALCDGLAPAVSESTELRNQIEKEAERKGLSALYTELKMIDADRASEVHPNDKRRIIRALEVFRLTGDKPSEVRKEIKSLQEQGYEVKIIGLKASRQILYSNAEKRVDEMVARGLENEVKKIKTRLSSTTLQAVGYKEIIEYLQGTCSLQEAVDNIKKHTRHLVKKQFTWFMRDKRIEWFDTDLCGNDTVLIDLIRCSVEKWLGNL